MAVSKLSKRSVGFKQFLEAEKKGNLIQSYGFTEISRDGPHIVISHGGNMGNTEERSVKPNVDKMLGKGAFDYLRKLGHYYKDSRGQVHNSPDYSYLLMIPAQYYDMWTSEHDQRHRRTSMTEGKTVRAVKKPRAEKLNRALMDKKGGAHYNAKTDYVRAKEKAKFRKALDEDTTEPDAYERYRDVREHARTALNHANRILATHYDRGPRYEKPDNDTLVRLARFASAVDNATHIIAAGTPDDKQDPMDE
jgi:hypothetical protein